MSPAILFPTIIATVGLVSCATVSKVGQDSMALVHKTTEATTANVSKLSEMATNKLRPSGVKVVEVREKELKDLPTGHERALAYENTRKRGLWSFMGPVDFKEPTLPETGGEMDGSLLPPKTP